MAQLVGPSGTRGHFNDEIGKMVITLSNQLREIANQIPENQKAIETFLKTGYPSSLPKFNGKLVYSYKDLSRGDRVKLIEQLGLGSISSATLEGLPRLIASLNQTDPDFAPKQMGGVQLDNFADIVEKALTADTADEGRRIYDTWSSGVRNLAGKLFAGHHAQPLMPMWNALQNANPNIRKGILQMMKDTYDIDFGEGSLEYLVKWAHRESDMTKLADGWLGALGVTTGDRGYLDEVFPHVKKGLAELTAHSSRFGGTVGDFLKPSRNLLKGVTSVKEGFELLKPFAMTARDAADQGAETSKFLRKYFFQADGTTIRPPEELKKILNSKEFSEGMSKIKRYGTVPPHDYPRLPKPMGAGGQVITGKAVWGDSDVPPAMMMQTDGTAVLNPGTDWKEMINKLDAPDSVKAQLRGFTEANDITGALRFARASRAMPWMAGISVGLGEWANSERRKEIAANPNDKYLKFQYMLDDWSLKADYASVGTYALAATGKGIAAPAGFELSSNLAALGSLGMDLDRWRKTPGAVEETLDYWKSVYARGSRGLLKTAQQFF